MDLPCLYQSEPKWKGKLYPLSEKRDCVSLMEPYVSHCHTEVYSNFFDRSRSPKQLKLLFQ